MNAGLVEATPRSLIARTSKRKLPAGTEAKVTVESAEGSLHSSLPAALYWYLARDLKFEPADRNSICTFACVVARSGTCTSDCPTGEMV